MYSRLISTIDIYQGDHKMNKIIAFLLLAGVLLTAQELIVNQEFTPSNMQKTRAMGWWVVKNKVNPAHTPCIFGDNTAKMTLAPGELGVTLIHKNPPMAPGKTYTVSFEAKGTIPQLNCYFEWIYADKKWGNSGTKHIKISKEWDKYSFQFTMPGADKKYHARPYLAIGLRKAGQVELRKVSIKEAQVQLLKNPEFSSNKRGTAASGWRVIPNGIKKGRTACLFAGKMAKLSVEPGEKGGFLVQRDIPFTAGQKYQISFEYKGDGKAQLRSYFEWIFADEKWGNMPTKVFKTAKEWQKASFVFAVPDKKFKTSPYLVFLLKVPGVCFVRNAAVIPLKSEVKIADPGFDAQKKNPWQLLKNASIDKTGGRKSPGVLCLNGVGAQAKLLLKLESGKNYRISYHVRGMENTKSSNGFSEFKAVMTLKSTGRVWGKGVQDCFQKHWQSRSELIRVPAEKSGDLEILLTALSPGKVQFDDFVLAEVEVPAEKFFNVVLKSPYFRQNFYASYPEKEVRGTVEFPAEIARCTVSFNGRKQVLKNTGKAVEFVFPAAKLAVGKYPLVFSGKSGNGKTVTEKIIITQLAPGKSEVIIGSDRKLYINGKRFFFTRLGSGRFPAVTWPFAMHDVADYYLKRTGLSVMFPLYMDDIKAFLDECHKKGVKAICRLECIGTWTKLKDEAKFKKFWQEQLKKLEAFKDHPALIGYYPYDEPLWNGFPVKMMEYTYNSLKQLDPYHPVFLVEAPRGMPENWKPYAQYCDVFGIDVYPIGSAKHSGLPEKGMRCVGDYTRLCYEAMKGHGTVEMVLQGFSWGNSKRTPAERKKMPYPTREEFRFMNFEALLHGASNLAYYVHRNYDPAFEKVMYEELCLMSRIEQIRLKGKKVSKNYPADKGVMTACYQLNGIDYIIFHNRSNKPGFVDLKSSGKKLYQLDFSKNIPVSAGRVTVPPLATRIYSTHPVLPDMGYAPLDQKMEKRLPEYFRKVTNMTTALDTQAFWIWGNTGSDLFCAARMIDIPHSLVSARLISAADDSYMLYVNGKAVQSGSYWMQYQETDLLPYLKKGKNIIAVYASNRGGAAGFLADLELVGKDGTRERITSDSSWQASSEVPAYNWLKKGISNGKNAKELFPFGKGPWNQ